MFARFRWPRVFHQHEAGIFVLCDEMGYQWCWMEQSCYHLGQRQLFSAFRWTFLHKLHNQCSCAWRLQCQHQQNYTNNSRWDYYKYSERKVFKRLNGNYSTAKDISQSLWPAILYLNNPDQQCTVHSESTVYDATSLAHLYLGSFSHSSL